MVEMSIHQLIKNDVTSVTCCEERTLHRSRLSVTRGRSGFQSRRAMPDQYLPDL